MVVKPWMVKASQDRGACGKAIRSIRPGLSIDDIHSSHLEWFEAEFPILSARIATLIVGDNPFVLRGAPPLGTLGFGDGKGDGDGSGDGYGDGSGDGYGDGSGYGYGSGYG